MSDSSLELSHNSLVKIAEKWLVNTKGCGFALVELNAFTQSGEIPDAIGFRSGISILIECKLSRADFLSDKKKKKFRIHPWMGVNYPGLKAGA